MPSVHATRTALVLVLGLSLVAATPLVFDVASLFELDGDAVDDPAGGAEDWDTLHAGGLGDGGSPIAFTGVVPDHCEPFACDIILTGGFSKDDLDLPSWTLAYGSNANHHDISDASAALYRDARTGHLVAYVGLDRFGSNIDTHVGFWFLQGPVAFDPSEPPTLTGSHAVGDLLVLSVLDSGGGSMPVSAFRWVGEGGDAGAGLSLQTLTIGGEVDVQVNTGGGSGGAAAGFDLAPWPYAHNITGPGDFPVGTFLEGRVDLTALLGPDLPCEYTSFIAETRSSVSLGAALKDIVFAPFPSSWSDLGDALPGISGPPELTGAGTLHAGTCMSLELRQAAPSAPAVLFVGLTDDPTPFKGGLLHPVPVLIQIALATNPSGEILLSSTWGPGLTGLSLILQYAIVDPAAGHGVALSNALRADVP